LQVINISNPGNLFFVESYDTPGDAFGVTISGNLIYVADGSGGLVILQIITIPPVSSVNIELVSQMDIPIYSISLDDNYAYMGTDSDLTVLDISNPVTPTIIGKSPTLSGTVSDIYVSDGYAYIVNEDNGLQILDISTPSTPTLVGSYKITKAKGVVVSGNLAYVIASGWDDLYIINVSNPNTPTLTGEYSFGSANGIAINGNFAYVAMDYFTGDDISTFRNGGLYVIDISTPTTPTFVSKIDLNSHYTTGVTINGNFVYVANGNSGLRIINVEDPRHPVLSGEYYTRGSYAEEVAISDNFAYVANGSGGLEVLHVSDPSNPVFSGRYDTPGSALGVAVSGDLVYVVTGSKALVILRVTPTSVYLPMIQK
jgi:hypothetical protein